MTGITAAAITAGASVLGTGASLYSSGQQRAQQGQAIDQASANQQAQLELQREMLRQQYQLSTAGQTDARGNQVIYDPGTNTWKTLLSPEGQALLARSDAINRMQDVQTLGRGATEKSLAYQRRLAEGSTAAPILDQLRYGYGAPTKAGVVGANKIAGATGASESADAARAGYTGAALRTGFGYAPLQQTLASVDRNATTGIRTAIANADATGNTDYNAALSGFQAPRANLYNAMATRASNVENIPFTPSNIPDTTETAMLNRAVRAPLTSASTYQPGTANTASQQLIGAIGAQAKDQLPIGSAFTTLGGALKDLYTAWNKKPTDSSNSDYWSTLSNQMSGGPAGGQGTI
jgi:hypothetical protein